MPVKKSNTSKSKSPWLNHVKTHYSKNKGKMTWKQSLQHCKTTYKSGKAKTTASPPPKPSQDNPSTY